MDANALVNILNRCLEVAQVFLALFFFHSTLFVVLLLVVFFCLNLWDGPVQLDRYLEVGHCTDGTSCGLQIFFVVLVFGLLSHFVGLVDRYYFKVLTFSCFVDRY